ncbi:2-dehydro-3-deoxygluconokinase [Pseudomonas sp. Marseille-QA0892]
MTRLSNLNAPVSVGLIGECMVELQQQPDGGMRQTFGGDTLNTAIYLRRVSDPGSITVDYITAVGEDPLSQAMRARWREEGVGDGQVRVLSDRLPGLYLIQTDAQGERTFLYWRGEAAARFCFDGPAADELLAALSGYQVLYLSGISLAILTGEGRQRLLAALRQAHDRGTRVIFDNNYRARLWPDAAHARTQYEALLALTDVALVTWEDDVAVFGFKTPDQLFSHYEAMGVREIILKRGAQSCLLNTPEGRAEVVAEQVDHIVDTTAAGDSFSAAYLAGRLQGAAPEDAARWGHRLAGTVIQHRGAVIPIASMPSMPTPVPHP